MFKKILLIAGLVVLVGALAFGAVNRTLAKSNTSEASLSGNGQGNGNSRISSDSQVSDVERITGNTQSSNARGGKGQGGSGSNEAQSGEYASLPPADGPLTTEEADALLFMYEEEKLARDVYLTLYDMWQVSTFQNIAGSEQTHMDSILALIDRYDVTNTSSSVQGVFTNPELQTLYDTLMAQGSLSVVDALKVGAAIEEVDILDLQERSLKTDNADILQVFESLEKGSENHLRAYVSALSHQTGEVYSPQFMTADAYNTILSASDGNGNGYRGGRKS